ncbi:MAG: NUDIX domain-containing protein [Clostridia bacterium]|nr:NUDIX domain-containing protein [Clostridia bacterium]
MTRSEKAIVTALCMVYDDNKILLQNRVKEDWCGITFPGGHIEKEESFVRGIKREIYEETGLTIYNPQRC